VFNFTCEWPDSATDCIKLRPPAYRGISLACQIADWVGTDFQLKREKNAEIRTCGLDSKPGLLERSKSQMNNGVHNWVHFSDLQGEKKNTNFPGIKEKTPRRVKISTEGPAHYISGI
jgi:hypothetical protein